MTGRKLLRFTQRHEGDLRGAGRRTLVGDAVVIV